MTLPTENPKPKKRALNLN